MRDRNKVLDEIIEYAKENENIRGLVLQGSLVNPAAPIDEFSDLDPMFVVAETENMADDDSWIFKFGNPISHCYNTIQLDEKEKWNQEMMLVLFEDGLKVDFSLFPVAAVETIKDLPLYQIVIDKDGCIPKPARKTEEGFYTEKPTEERFVKRMNGFLWDTTYVAKSLWRGEMYFAKFMFDLLHRYMEEVIAWHLGAKSNWTNNPGVCGRYFHRQMGPDHWQMVLDTYAGSDVEDNWRALFASLKLVRVFGRETAKLLNYPYPEAHHDRIFLYLNKVKDMSTNLGESS